MSSGDESEMDIVEHVPPKMRERLIGPNLPAKSKERYIKIYDQYLLWQNENDKDDTFSESVLMDYFTDLAKFKSPSTLWSTFSMLKSVLYNKHNIAIQEYKKLVLFLRKQASGYRTKTSLLFTSEDINRFLNEAPDYRFLAIKVVLILGIQGACRCSELTNMTVNDIKYDQIMIVVVRNDENQIDRTFVVHDEFVDIVKKYQNLRPIDAPTDRFFLNYQNGKCTKQVIGKNKIAAMPKNIAKYLELPSPERYTGHCFRRTTLVKQRAMKSKKVNEPYIEDFTQIKLEPDPISHSPISNQSLNDPSNDKEVSEPQASPHQESSPQTFLSDCPDDATYAEVDVNRHTEMWTSDVQADTTQTQPRISTKRKRSNLRSSKADNTWLMELERRQIAAEEKLSEAVMVMAEAAKVTAQAAMIQAEAAQSQAKALLSLSELLKR